MTGREPLKNKMTLPKIGTLQLENPFILAPMAGISDAPMRRICREMGASFTYSEMVSAKAMYYGDKKTNTLLETFEEELPVAFQIFGHEPDIMAFAAEKLEPLPNATLDINMGCPVPKVVKNGDGSAIMKQPELAGEVVRAVVNASSKPVTVKIRAGFTDNNRNAVEVALACQEAGAAAVAVHGRTREQYYSGYADRSIIRDVKQALTIPVIGNGDVVDVPSALGMLEETGCDFVMVGRGVKGNPWLFRDLKNLWEGRPQEEPPTLEDKKQMMKRQMRELMDLKGEYVAVREMRKVAGWYLTGVPGGAKFRNEINRITEAKPWFEMIDAL